MPSEDAEPATSKVFREFYYDELPSISEAVHRVLRRADLSNGQEVAAFENECASLMRNDHGIATSSCTVGLTLAIKLLAPRARVAIPWFSFCATVLPIIWNQGIAVFGKIDERTWNLDFEWTKEALESERADAVLFLATAGNVSGLSAFEDLASFFRVPLIVDAAGALGSYDNVPPAERAMKATSVQVVSFASKKPLPIGEGGMIFTNSKDIADGLRRLRQYGSNDGYYCREVGFNGRMSEISAVIGRTFIRAFPKTLEKRRLIARSITEQTQGSMRWQQVEQASQSSYADVLGLVDADIRPLLIDSFRHIGIEAVPFYDPSVALHPAFASSGSTIEPDVHKQLSDFAGRTFAFRPVSNLTPEHTQAIIDALRRPGAESGYAFTTGREHR
jgi:dTDP-4-amino-4,6-dideoxygalactose transaminase